MRPQGTPQQLEKRRRQAIQLLQKGKKSLSAVARYLSASKSSVSRWYQAYKIQGLSALKPKPTPGRPCRLSQAQKRRLGKWLLKGPLALGYSTDLWTLRRIANFVKKKFHVLYHPNHLWRLLRDIGWSCQKPERRALQRKEKEIARWKYYHWPRIKKNEKTWCPSGFP